MKPSRLACLLLISAISVAPALAQQPRAHRTREQGHRVDPRAANETFQLLGFTITTGGDDLRTDSVAYMHLTFQDDPSYDCALHGSNVQGASANLSWDNNSTHDAPPCRLKKPMTLANLRQVMFSLVMSSNDVGASPDNWNVNRVLITAYNPGSSGKACVFDVGGNPLARLTGDQPQVTVSDFPNRCR
ncbi:MAG: hypothetical protein OJF55_000153 [Rhodanobacteraceae bacterium]|nr:MAG: hypothetical protein OJF55_000153 [Rhodanobacteraceae bacterium]